MKISRDATMGEFVGCCSVGANSGFRGLFYVGGRRVKLRGRVLVVRGDYKGRGSWDSGYFLRDVENKRIFPTLSSGSSWGVDLQRNLMFANYSGAIVVWEKLFMTY